MKYRLQALDDDGLVTSDTEIDALHIPKGGDLVVILPPLIPDWALERIATDLHKFFEGRHRVLVMRGEDVKFMRIVEEPPE